MTNVKTGKVERVFVNLEAVYPNENDPNEEVSFEELRAKSRGWLSRDWAAESRQRVAEERQQLAIEKELIPAISNMGQPVEVVENSSSQQDTQPGKDTQDGLGTTLENTLTVDIGQEGRSGRPRKTKLREVKGETQTSMYRDCVLWLSRLICYSQNEPRVAHWTKVEKEEFCGAHHDSPH